MTLIEVLVAAVLVGVIAVGTFTAFDAAGRSGADTRAHAQATQLSQQDEERLRGLTTSQIAQLGSVETVRAENGACLEKVAGVWTYWNQARTFFCEKPSQLGPEKLPLAGQTYNGVAFTVVSSSRYVAAAKGAEGAAFLCEKTGAAANYLQTTSSVTWPGLGSRPAVSQSSILTTPSSGVLLVKVVNQNNEPVEGATVTVTGSSLNAVQTTPAGGCVIFGGLAAGTDTVTASKVNWVDKQGKYPTPTKSVTVTTASVTETSFTIGEPGSIIAEFESNGSTVGVLGDTFYALQTEMTSPPDFVGGTAGKYESSVTLNKLLFPFVKVGKPPGEAPYTVFAGDCEANNPAKVTEAGEKLKGRPAQVQPNGSGVPGVKVEVPPVNATVYEGSKAEVEAAEKAKTPPKYITGSPEYSMIINKECEAGTAQNVVGTVPFKHTVTFSSEGHIVEKYQPYAKEMQLCIVAKLGTTYYKYKSPAPFANKLKAGITLPTVYMKSATKAGEYENTKTAGKLKCP